MIHIGNLYEMFHFDQVPKNFTSVSKKDQDRAQGGEHEDYFAKMVSLDHPHEDNPAPQAQSQGQ